MPRLGEGAAEDDERRRLAILGLVMHDNIFGGLIFIVWGDHTMSWLTRHFRRKDSPRSIPGLASLIPEGETLGRELPHRDWAKWERDQRSLRTAMETPTDQECARFPPGARLGLTRLGGSGVEHQGTVESCYKRLREHFAKVRLDNGNVILHLPKPLVGIAVRRHLRETGHSLGMYDREFEARDSRGRAFAVRVL